MTSRPRGQAPPAFRWLKRCVFPGLVALVAGLGVAHILVRTSTYGASLSNNDVFNYLAAAESLVAGDGLLSPGGGQMVLFAPFFSVAMAFLSLLGIEPVEGGRLLNAAAFGLVILASGLWLGRRLKSRAVALGAAVAVMAALPLAHSASTLLSEPLFILFTLLALMPLESFLNRRSGRGALALSAVLAALSAVTRYIGVALIFSAVLMLLLRRDVPVRERLKDSLIFGVISSLPLAAVMTRNYFVSGTLTGDRSLALGQSLLDSLAQIVAVFEGWADPLSAVYRELPHSPWLIGGVVLLLAALLVILPRPGRGGYVFWVFALAYIVIVVVVVPFTSWQNIDSRYLVPVYVPLLFVGAFWLDGLLGRRATGGMAAFRWGLVAVALIGGGWHTGVSAQENLRLTAEGLESGYIGKSLNTAYWDDSELVEYVRANPVKGRYYSNDPNVLRWNAGVTGTRVSWVAVPRRGAQAVNDCQGWFERAILKSAGHQEPEKYVVWVGQGEGGRIVCRSWQMESPLPLEPVAELADGAVFRLNADYDGGDAAVAARQSAYDAAVSGEPVIRSDFDVYLSDNTLFYVREPCDRADTEATFFLHLWPVDGDDLPAYRQQHGFDNLDFNFAGSGAVFDGRCVAMAALPGYAIARIGTGQYVFVDGDFRHLWEGEIRLNE